MTYTHPYNMITEVNRIPSYSLPGFELRKLNVLGNGPVDPVCGKQASKLDILGMALRRASNAASHPRSPPQTSLFSTVAWMLLSWLDHLERAEYLLAPSWE